MPMMSVPSMQQWRELPLAFWEDEQEERERLAKLQAEDPITLQDVFNTSRALVDAVRDEDVEELRTVVARGEAGEFLQFFVLQACAMSLRNTSLDIVRALVQWGVPLQHEMLSHSMHLVCEVTTRDNFSSAWRILQVLKEGNAEGRLDINEPRPGDGWTPLCVACARACLPLTVKLLELGADPNVITRASETPVALAKRPQPDDTDEQREARKIIANMLRAQGGADTWRDALARAKRS